MEYDWLGFGYAALVAAGGVVGYAKAGSVPSLAAGLLFGGLAGLGAYQQSKDPKNVWLSLVASGTLSAVMGMRFYNSRKAMPGIIAGASLLMVGRLGLQIMEKPLKPTDVESPCYVFQNGICLNKQENMSIALVQLLVLQLAVGKGLLAFVYGRLQD
ncbi:transmembrane protein 14C-like [Grus japonensis]|uniref:Transmembrane protein 14C n=12 Tax=Neoaves TaxID=3078114 RepID=A0ABC9WE59_GRUJA